MSKLRLRTDLQRAVVKGFAFPLGIEPGEIEAPTQGYTIAFTPGSGEDDEPDTYVFHIVVSHEQVAPILYKAFELLPARVYGIIEIGSRDAYRSVDVYMGEDLVQREEFVRTWRDYEPLLLEDGSIAAGANSEDPFVEVFLDHWKGFYIHVPVDMREEVESMLQQFGLEEVPQTWHDMDENDAAVGTTQLRPVLASNGTRGRNASATDRGEVSDAPDIDELLMQLRHEWRLELNVDPESNVDEAGRELGLTLWHAIVTVDESREGSHEDVRADVSIWATAGSLIEMQELIDSVLTEHPQWMFVENFAVDRVAFDERPDELADLAPRRDEAEVHMVQFEPWSPEEDEKDGPPGDKGGPAPRHT